MGMVAVGADSDKKNTLSFALLYSLLSYLEWARLGSAAVSIFVVILVELTNTVFVNSNNITTNIETAVLSKEHILQSRWQIFLGGSE